MSGFRLVLAWYLLRGKNIFYGMVIAGVDSNNNNYYYCGRNYNDALHNPITTKEFNLNEK